MQHGLEETSATKRIEMVGTCAFLHLRMASRAVTRLFDEILRPSGLRATQLSVLVPISLNSPITITHLAEELVMDRTSLSRLLKPLEKSGLVRIVSGEDQRTREVALTLRGQEAVAQAIPLWEKAQAHVVQEMGEERWLKLREDLAATVLIASRQ